LKEERIENGFRKPLVLPLGVTLPLGVGADVLHDGTDHSDVGLCRLGLLGPRVMTFHDGN
jgi:hypothetical protein